MAITKLSTNGIYGDKYGDIAANNNNWYEAIATVSVGATSQATIEFTNIPQDYTHLQIRGIVRSTASTGGTEKYRVRLNGDSGSNYSWHLLYGNGSSAVAQAGSSTTLMQGTDSVVSNGATSNTFGSLIIDILDYKDTSKFKTIRILDGADINGAGYVALSSGNWRNTNAITSIAFTMQVTADFRQYSRISLYGVRG